jgi:cellulose synthase/poly-beta-1,6-N-acetylglucosamine synthase-like glycosyltransferase
MNVAHLLIWISLAFLFYVHFGYPLVLLVWRKLAARPVRKGFWEPRVSILIAAHNERDTIEQRILNCLQLDYPFSKLQVVLVLDAPTDGTEAVASRYESSNVLVIPLAPHKGKSGALNHAVSAATGEILVFTDARQQFDRLAIRELVANFRDPEVGSVSGELVLLDQDGYEAADGTGIYWRYEKWLRVREGEIHSMLGATGAIYAVRRELYQPIPADTILDDVAIPMNIVLSGKRAIFDGLARAYDRVSATPEAEYGRKVRTLMGNYQLMAQMPALLSPFRNPVWLQFVSHKVARLLVPYFLMLLFLANLFATDGVYLWLLGAQVGWYVLTCVGGFLSTPAMEAQRP